MRYFCLDVVDSLRQSFSQGLAFQPAMDKVIQYHDGPEYFLLKSWLSRRRAGQTKEEVANLLKDLFSTPGRRAMMIALENGYCGAPIDKALEELQLEFFNIIQNELEKQIQLLPLKFLIPLIFLIMPSVLSLLLAPLLNSLLGGL